MPRYPRTPRFAKRVLTPSQLTRRNNKYRHTHNEARALELKEALSDKPALVMVFIQDHYLFIRYSNGRQRVIIITFAMAKKHLHSCIFYSPIPYTIINLFHIIDIKTNDEGKILIILPHDWVIILDKDDENTEKVLIELWHDPRVVREISRLSTKRKKP